MHVHSSVICFIKLAGVVFHSSDQLYLAVVVEDIVSVERRKGLSYLYLLRFAVRRS